MPKSVLKSIQTCFEHVLGKIFRKNFLPSVPWRVEFSKIFNKKKFSKFQKCPKVFPKVSKHVLNMFWGKLFEKFYAQCSMEGRVFENFPIVFSKFQKCPKSFPKVSKRVLNLFWGKLLENFFAQCSVEGRVFENFHKKYFQNSKNAQKCSQKYPNVF